MYQTLGISKEILTLAKKVEEEVKDEFKKVDEVCEYNSLKVLNAFQKYHVSDMHFNSTTGYGYSDIGRDTIEKIFADILIEKIRELLDITDEIHIVRDFNSFQIRRLNE